MKQNQNGKVINWWKWAFLLLLASQIALFGTLASRMISLREPKAETLSKSLPKSVSLGTFSTTKDQLNQAILSYLKPYQNKQMTYKLYVAQDKVMFEGKYHLLGYAVPLYVYFEPYSLKDGSVQLHVTSFSVGTLPLPKKEILQYIKSSYDLPNFVHVEPKKSAILIAFPQMENESGIFIKSQKIDLIGDEIRFEIYKKNEAN